MHINYDLKRIGCIDRNLTEDASKILVTLLLYYILSARLPQFSPYGHGYTRFCHQPLQQVQNSAARHILIWHPVVTTLHHSCKKNCTGFSLQNASSTKLHAFAFMLQAVLALILTSLNWYVSMCSVP